MDETSHSHSTIALAASPPPAAAQLLSSASLVAQPSIRLHQTSLPLPAQSFRSVIAPESEDDEQKELNATFDERWLHPADVSALLESLSSTDLGATNHYFAASQRRSTISYSKLPPVTPQDSCSESPPKARPQPPRALLHPKRSTSRVVDKENVHENFGQRQTSKRSSRFLAMPRKSFSEGELPPKKARREARRISRRLSSRPVVESKKFYATVMDASDILMRIHNTHEMPPQYQAQQLL